MARAVNQLSVKRHIENGNLEPGLYADGGGLYLQISGQMTKSWIFRFMLAGRARKMGLGPAGPEPKITLAAARALAADARKLLMQGVDPIGERDARKAALAADSAKVMTFGQCARAYLEANQAGWKNRKHADQWQVTVMGITATGRPTEVDYCKALRNLPVDAIDTAVVLKVLQPIWNTRTETASRLRGRIESILDWARVRGYRNGENAARWRGHLEHLLPARSRVAPVEHHAALPFRDMPACMAQLRDREGVSARALEFLILTAARTGDVLGAKWSEIDLKEHLWTVPAERLKGRKGARRSDHVVPLCERAIAILRSLPREGDFIFPGARERKGLAKAAMAEVLKTLAPDATVHGFRSTFKDWCAEQTAYPNELSELALAHTISSRVESAYRRLDQREKRRRMMADWSDYCAGRIWATANVVPIRAS
jgi:integrase